MSESNVFMVWFYDIRNVDDIRCAGVYSTVDDAVSRITDLEEDGIPEDVIWMEEYVMNQDIKI